MILPTNLNRPSFQKVFQQKTDNAAGRKRKNNIRNSHILKVSQKNMFVKTKILTNRLQSDIIDNYNSMVTLLVGFEKFLDRLNRDKDEFLFFYIRKYWPRFITPNDLTIARFIIAGILFVLLFNFKHASSIVIIPLFFVGILTDLLDGSVARALGLITRTGEILDPIADRALIIPVAVYSLLADHKLLLVT